MRVVLTIFGAALFGIGLVLALASWEGVSSCVAANSHHCDAWGRCTPIDQACPYPGIIMGAGVGCIGAVLLPGRHLGRGSTPGLTLSREPP